MENGKDTAAEALYEVGYLRAPLAGTLKAMLKTMALIGGVDGAIADRMFDGDLKKLPAEVFNGKTPRDVMRSLGTAWGRECVSDTIWLDTWRRRWVAKRHDEACVGLAVTDCRFPNEATYLKRMGAEIFVIKRPGFQKPAQ